MDSDRLCLFALNASRGFGVAVAQALGVPLSAHEEREFEDGEHKCRPLTNVRGKDAFVVQSLYTDADESVNDKLLRLLFFIGSLRDAAADRVTAVVPYLCYSRKDRKTKARDPITTRYVAGLFEAVGTDRVVTLDVHNLAAFQNAFRCHTDHLEAKKLFVRYFGSKFGGDDLTVVSPDIGGVKRAESFREALSSQLGKPIASAFMEKQRSGGVVSGEKIVGDVEGKTAIIIDDLISTGTTISRTVDACTGLGAEKIHAVATHGVFVSESGKQLANPRLDSVVVTDSIPPFRLDPRTAKDKLVVLEAAPLFGEAIQEIHTGGSISSLLEE